MFVLEGHGRAVGATVIVVQDAKTLVLEALSPIGVGLFTVHLAEGEATVEAIDSGFAKSLAKLPLARDLTALYVAGGARRERVSRWSVRPTVDGWRMRGPGGSVRVRRVQSGLELRDRLRAYTLTVTDLR
jgi:hypothetical protein